MKVAIITEGFQGTGYGHLTRCLSICQAFEEEGIAPVFIANCDEQGKTFIPNVNLLQLNWIENEKELLKIIDGFDIAIIDSYLAPLNVYENIYRTVKKAVYLDDYIRLDYPAGTIVNGAIAAENIPYKKDEKHDYLLGINFTPLRKEFWDVDIPKKAKKEIKNILITFGAQDIRNLTAEVLNFLINDFPQFNYHIIYGKRDETKASDNKNVHYYSGLNAYEMLALMLNSDLAISAAGQTTYELARLGLPAIAIGTAENQKYNLQGWVAEGFIKKEIWWNENNLFEMIGEQLTDYINLNISNGKIFCDGQGARKIRSYLI